MSIGAITIKKKEILKENEFVNEGFKNYISRLQSSEVKENSELNYYYRIIDNISNPDIYRYVIKDVSGSIFVNGSIILGLKNPNLSKNLNINNSEWHDPYSLYIKEIINQIPDHLKIFFTRKTLKKPLMTKYYKCGLASSAKYFMEEVKKIPEYSDMFYDEIIDFFKKYVHTEWGGLEKNILFEHSTQEYENFLKKNQIDFIEYSDFIINLTNFKMKKKRIDIVIFGKRISLTNYELTGVIDKRKNNSSTIANIFHSFDGLTARNLIKKYEGSSFVIHDAFGFAYTNSEAFIIIANYSFNTVEKNKIFMGSPNINNFSNFIIL